MGSLYTSFSGRIPRKSFWWGIVGIIVLSFVLGFALMAMGFTSGTQTVSQVQRNGGPIEEITSFQYSLSPLGTLIAQLITLVPLLALSVKRRHDLDNPGYDAIAISALGFLSTVLKLAGIDGGIVWVLDVALLIGGIYLLVVLGFLRGTPGPNRYGPDPLGGATAA